MGAICCCCCHCCCCCCCVVVGEWWCRFVLGCSFLCLFCVFVLRFMAGLFYRFCFAFLSILKTPLLFSCPFNYIFSSNTLTSVEITSTTCKKKTPNSGAPAVSQLLNQSFVHTTPAPAMVSKWLHSAAVGDGVFTRCHANPSHPPRASTSPPPRWPSG